MTPPAAVAVGRAGRPGVRWLAAAGALGVLTAAGQAPLGAWWLSLPGLAGVIWIVAMQPARGPAAWLAWFAGAGYFAAALFWIVEPFLVDPLRHAWMAPFALVLMAFGLALFWAAAAWVATYASGASAVRRSLAFAVTLALCELGRGYLFTGFPWALIGHVWIATPAVQLAALAGPLGLTALATFAAALPVAAWFAAGARHAAVGGAAAAFVVAAVWGAGAWRAAQPLPEPAHEARVRLVQPNAEQHLKWQPEWVHRFFERTLDLTAERGSGPPPDLVLWPETAVPYLMDNADAALARASGAAGIPVFTGVQRRDGQGRFYNSLALIGDNGEVTHLYDKHHLVPFGEYVPLSHLLDDTPMAGLAARQLSGYSAGPGPEVFDLGALGRVAPQICYETVFSRHLHVSTRPDWIFQATNDAWFGRLTGPYQHLAQARLRAVEQGLPLLRAANTGVSAVIDARGRVLARIGLGEAGFLDARLPAALPATPYSRYGDLPLGLALGVVLVGIAALRSRRLQAKA